MPLKRTQQEQRGEPKHDRESQCTSNGKRTCWFFDWINRERTANCCYRCNKRPGAEETNKALISGRDTWWLGRHCGTAEDFANNGCGRLLIERQLKLFGSGAPISVTKRHAGRPAGAFDAGQSSRYEQ